MGAVITRLCHEYTTHKAHNHDVPGGVVAYCTGRTMMGDLLPEQMTECLDCEILSVRRCNLPNYHRPSCNCGGITDKCVFHGKHEGHKLRLQAYKETDGAFTNRYYCASCRKWAWDK